MSNIARYDAQKSHYTQALGQLDDGGNTATVAHYLELFDNADLKRYDVKPLRTNAGSPCFMVHDSSLVTPTWQGRGDLLGDSVVRGHLVESAVGVYLLARSRRGRFWWGDANVSVESFLVGEIPCSSSV